MFLFKVFDLLLNDFQVCLLMSRLFCEPPSSKQLLIRAREEDTASTVLGTRAAMESYSTSAWYLFENGQQPLELRTPRHCYLIDQCRHEIVSVFESIADGVQHLSVLLCPVVEIMRSPKQSSANRFAICRHSYQFIISHCCLS